MVGGLGGLHDRMGVRGSATPGVPLPSHAVPSFREPHRARVSGGAEEPPAEAAPQGPHPTL